MVFLIKHCREQFVELHKQPILQDLATFWEEKFGGLEYVVAVLTKKAWYWSGLPIKALWRTLWGPLIGIEVSYNVAYNVHMHMNNTHTHTHTHITQVQRQQTEGETKVSVHRSIPINRWEHVWTYVILLYYLFVARFTLVRMLCDQLSCHSGTCRVSGRHGALCLILLLKCQVVLWAPLYRALTNPTLDRWRKSLHRDLHVHTVLVLR